MKRVALIRNSYSYDVGGAEIFPVNLAKLVPAKGYEPVILSANNKTRAIAASAHIKTTRSPWWSFQNFSGAGLLLFPVYLVWILAVAGWYLVYFIRHRIDVVHPQSRDDFIAATLAAKLLRKQVVWSDHADLKHIYLNHQTWYKNPVGKLVYLAGKLAQHVTIESQSERRLIEQALGKPLPPNYAVIYLGVLDSHPHPRSSGGALTFVSTSRLVKDKGIAELIRAFQSLNMPNTRLNICGDGPDAALFTSIAADATNITFLGHIDDVIGTLQQSDVLVHPTYHEGFGLSLVEAEMCGLPIIASNVGSIPEIVQDGVSGILVSPKDVPQLADAMERLAKDPQLRTSMGQHGRTIYLNMFQFDRIVNDQLIPLYNE